MPDALAGARPDAAPGADLRMTPGALVAMLIEAYETGLSSPARHDAGPGAATPRVARAGGGRRA